MFRNGFMQSDEIINLSQVNNHSLEPSSRAPGQSVRVPGNMNAFETRPEIVPFNLRVEHALGVLLLTARDLTRDSDIFCSFVVCDFRNNESHHFASDPSMDPVALLQRPMSRSFYDLCSVS